MGRIQKAWKAGFTSGRYWSNHQRQLDDVWNRMNPYTNYAVGIQCHVAWQMGFVTAFVLRGKAEPRDWSIKRRLYAL